MCNNLHPSAPGNALLALTECGVVPVLNALTYRSRDGSKQFNKLRMACKGIGRISGASSIPNERARAAARNKTTPSDIALQFLLSKRRTLRAAVFPSCRSARVPPDQGVNVRGQSVEEGDDVWDRACYKALEPPEMSTSDVVPPASAGGVVI
jgi:hypothetical protein